MQKKELVTNSQEILRMWIGTLGREDQLFSVAFIGFYKVRQL